MEQGASAGGRSNQAGRGRGLARLECGHRALDDELSEALELRFAERPEGPWSEPAILARTSDYSFPYGAYMTPSWIEQGGLTFYFAMSQFGTYNTYVMKAELQRRSE